MIQKAWATRTGRDKSTFNPLLKEFCHMNYMVELINILPCGKNGSPPTMILQQTVKRATSMSTTHMYWESIVTWEMQLKNTTLLAALSTIPLVGSA